MKRIIATLGLLGCMGLVACSSGPGPQVAESHRDEGIAREMLREGGVVIGGVVVNPESDVNGSEMLPAAKGSGALRKQSSELSALLFERLLNQAGDVVVRSFNWFDDNIEDAILFDFLDDVSAGRSPDQTFWQAARQSRVGVRYILVARMELDEVGFRGLFHDSDNFAKMYAEMHNDGLGRVSRHVDESDRIYARFREKIARVMVVSMELFDIETGRSVWRAAGANAEQTTASEAAKAAAANLHIVEADEDSVRIRADDISPYAPLFTDVLADCLDALLTRMLTQPPLENFGLH